MLSSLFYFLPLFSFPPVSFVSCVLLFLFARLSKFFFERSALQPFIPPSDFLWILILVCSSVFPPMLCEPFLGFSFGVAFCLSTFICLGVNLDFFGLKLVFFLQLSCFKFDRRTVLIYKDLLHTNSDAKINGTKLWIILKENFYAQLFTSSVSKKNLNNFTTNLQPRTTLSSTETRLQTGHGVLFSLWMELG